MRTSLRVAVLGGGVMGSAAAWMLARDGHQVTLLERGAPGHLLGASHGTCRNFNVGYAAPHYLSLVQEAGALWRQLEDESGETLLELTGVVSHGDPGPLGQVHRALGRAGMASEWLSPKQAGQRWPGMRFATPALHMPQAGRVYADRAVRVLQELTGQRGGQVFHEAEVRELVPGGADGVRVHYVHRGAEEVLAVDRAVVTVGAWTSKLLGHQVRLPPLVVTQEQPAHFRPRDEAPWPSFNHLPDPRSVEHRWWCAAVYGMSTPGEGVKVGWHAAGRRVDPDARDFRPEPTQLEALRRYAREWLPGVDPDSWSDISCTYTLTPDEDFVLDRVGPVVVGAGFSGHGFKFAPAVGRVLADLAVGTPAPKAFALDRSPAGPQVGRRGGPAGSAVPTAAAASSKSSARSSAPSRDVQA